MDLIAARLAYSDLFPGVMTIEGIAECAVKTWGDPIYAAVVLERYCSKLTTWELGFFGKEPSETEQIMRQNRAKDYARAAHYLRKHAED